MTLTTLALICALAAPVTAQTLTDPMRAAFSDLTQAALHLDGGSGLHIGFHDLRAARTIVIDRGTEGFEPGAMAMAFVAPPRMAQVLPQTGDDGWATRIGFTPAQVTTITSIEAAPLVSYQVQLAPGVAETADRTLRQNGYEEQEIDGQRLLMRGGDDFELDIRRRDIADPFGGQLGQASRIGITGDLLRYSSSTPFLTLAMRSRGASLADHPDMDAMLDAVDGSDLGGGQLMQALVLSDPFLFAADGISPIGEEAVPQEVPPAGPWTMGLLVHITDGTTDRAMVVMAFGDAASASDAAERLPETMAGYTSVVSRSSLAELFGSPPVVRQSAINPRVVLIDVATPMDQNARIPRPQNFMRVLQLIFNRDAPFLSPL